MNILQEIAERTKERIEAQKNTVSLEQIIEMAQALCVSPCLHDSERNSFLFPFEQALRTDDIAFICEIKKASPSKGVI